MATNLIPAHTPRWKIYTLLGIIVFALGLKAYNSWWPKAEVVIGGATLRVLVADTAAQRYRGWSEKKTMGKYDGMLFVFSDLGQHTMVMRNMQFPLDIIWLKNNVIIEIAPNVQPEPGRSEGMLTPYFSRADSDAVLELPAGSAKNMGLKIGDRVLVNY